MSNSGRRAQRPVPTRAMLSAARHLTRSCPDTLVVGMGQVRGSIVHQPNALPACLLLPSLCRDGTIGFDRNRPGAPGTALLRQPSWHKRRANAHAPLQGSVSCPAFCNDFSYARAAPTLNVAPLRCHLAHTGFRHTPTTGVCRLVKHAGRWQRVWSRCMQSGPCFCSGYVATCLIPLPDTA